MRIFVTGGAGYIGSHVSLLLGGHGHNVLVYDNLSTGHEWAVLSGKLVRGDLEDKKLLTDTMREYAPDAVMHFAASIQVEESVREPLKYYRNNFVNTMNLLEAMTDLGVRYFVYSSSAATYGAPDAMRPIAEDTLLKPINPYGTTKAMTEKVLEDLCAARDFRYIALRYFNVAGADPQARIGQAYREATHLITRSLKVALGEYEFLSVFGNDYPTPDGTCVRDYIHVEDLAGAHLLALMYLRESESSGVMNCGYGHGYSVLDIVEAVRKVTGVDIAIRMEGRRAGDPPSLIADGSRLKKLTGWSPLHDDIEFIIGTAWKWEQKMAKR